MATESRLTGSTKGQDQGWVVSGWMFWQEQFNAGKVADKRGLWELTNFIKMFNRNANIKA